MKIAFFGTYFLYFEKIILSCSLKNKGEFYFFTDKESYSHLFKNINTTYIDLENDSLQNNYIFNDEEINNFFACDNDRHNEFNIKKPSISNLKKTANLIINNFQKWHAISNPELLLCEGPNNFFNRVIINFLEKNKINYYTFRMGRISNSVYLEKNKVPIFNNYFVNDINTNKDYMNSNHPLHRNLIYKLINFKETSLLQDLKRLFKYWEIIKKEDKLLPYSGNTIETILKIRILYIKKSLLNIFLNIINLQSYSDDEEYLVYPEHYRPESSTSAHDYKYINDLKNYKLIREKVNIIILFRFHPTYFTKRPILQFLKILCIAKQYISLPKQSLNKLISNSRGTVSISSSFALDTIKMGKPALVLGHPEYLNSKVIKENLLILRKKEDFLKVEQYLKNYKKIDIATLEHELQKLYHPCSMYGGEWINFLVKEAQK